MPKLSRPALIISACIFVCALMMLCVAQLSALRVSPVDLGPQAAVTAVQLTDAGGSTDTADTSATEVALADLSSELSEPMLPMAAPLSSEVRAMRPAAPVAVALPQPLIEGPQRPPRVLRA